MPAPAPSRPDAIPRQPQGWAIACPSSALRRGAVRRVEVMGRAAVAFRDAGGRAAVVAAHCPHMGAHLGGGRVTAEGLECPLHGWTFDAAGTCRRSGGGRTCRPGALFAYPVEERYGAVFAFNGPAPTHGLPDLGDLRARAGRPARVEAPWEAVSANGFDVQHLHAVHGRALREPPAVEALGDVGFELRYVSRVTGTGLSDRVMKALSGDRIEATVRAWAGTLAFAESRVRGRTTRLLLSIAPACGGRATVVTPVFAAPRGPASRPTLRLAAWLFRSFLAPDAAALRDIAFHPPRPSPADAAVLAYLDVLRGLPQFAGPAD